MIVEIKFEDITEDRLFIRALSDPKIIANVVPYLLEEYTKGTLSVFTRGDLMLLEDKQGNIYKTITSKSGVFNFRQSCTKGIGRDESFGNWDKFIRDNAITYLIQVNSGYRGKIVCEFVRTSILNKAA